MGLSQKKLFLLDLDGTIYLEEALLPGAAEFLTWARERGCAVRYLTNNSSRGADFLATNPDLACPTLFGYIPDCGSICQLLVNACGRRPVYIGQRDPTMIRLAWEQTGYGPAETLMVGDRLYTDIACGVNAGTDTALVLTGEATAADAAVSDTPPTLICRDMAELLERLKEARQESC